jgi:transaldolase
MGASFRNLDEIVELAGCDLLTIAPKLLADLQQRKDELERKLDPEKAKNLKLDRIAMNESIFRDMHAKDRMANEKLDEGIAGFTKAIQAAEKLLAERYQVLQGKARSGELARGFFQVYDLDGDGLITREEWTGSDAVFDALDRDGDGTITAEEMSAGLGCAFVLR